MKNHPFECSLQIVKRKLRHKEKLENTIQISLKKQLNYETVAPETLKGMIELEKYVAGSGLERSLYELVELLAPAAPSLLSLREVSRPRAFCLVF